MEVPTRWTGTPGIQSLRVVTHPEVGQMLKSHSYKSLPHVPGNPNKHWLTKLDLAEIIPIWGG